MEFFVQIQKIEFIYPKVVKPNSEPKRLNAYFKYKDTQGVYTLNCAEIMPTIAEIEAKIKKRLGVRYKIEDDPLKISLGGMKVDE